MLSLCDDFRIMNEYEWAYTAKPRGSFPTESSEKEHFFKPRICVELKEFLSTIEIKYRYISGRGSRRILEIGNMSVIIYKEYN